MPHTIFCCLTHIFHSFVADLFLGRSHRRSVVAPPPAKSLEGTARILHNETGRFCSHHRLRDGRHFNVPQARRGKTKGRPPASTRAHHSRNPMDCLARCLAAGGSEFYCHPGQVLADCLFVARDRLSVSRYRPGFGGVPRRRRIPDFCLGTSGRPARLRSTQFVRAIAFGQFVCQDDSSGTIVRTSTTLHYT